MSDKTRFLVRLKRGRKRVVLTLNGGVLFKDMQLARDVARVVMARDGWKEATIDTLDPDDDGRYCIGLREVPPELILAVEKERAAIDAASQRTPAAAEGRTP